MPAKMLTIRDGINSWLAAVDGTGSWNSDISKASQRINGWLAFGRVQFFPAVQITWGREEGRQAELSRTERDLFFNLLLVTKMADMRAADDFLAGLQADVKNRLEVPDTGPPRHYLGLSTVDIKGVTVEDVDPVEVEEEQAAEGIVVWNLTVKVRYRHARGGA